MKNIFLICLEKKKKMTFESMHGSWPPPHLLHRVNVFISLNKISVYSAEIIGKTIRNLCFHFPKSGLRVT